MWISERNPVSKDTTPKGRSKRLNCARRWPWNWKVTGVSFFCFWGKKESYFYSFFLGLKFNSWKKVLPEVLSAINYSKKTSRNPRDILKDYFTSEYPVLPQHMDFYKFKIGELVGLDLTRPQRSNLTYKYSLYYGRMNKRTSGVIVKRRLVTAA